MQTQSPGSEYLEQAPILSALGTLRSGQSGRYLANWQELMCSLISGGADGSMSIWDLESGEENAYSAAPTDDEVAEGIRHVPLQTCNKYA